MHSKRDVNYTFNFDKGPLSFMKTFKNRMVKKIDKMHGISTNEHQLTLMNRMESKVVGNIWDHLKQMLFIH